MPVYELESVQVHTEQRIFQQLQYHAYKPNGELITEAATGAGSVEAIFNTLERFVNGKVQFWITV